MSAGLLTIPSSNQVKATEDFMNHGEALTLKDNTNATMPIIYQNDTPHQEPSTAFLENGSFLRMKSLRVGYELGKVLKNKVSSLQIYFQGTNLFTITDYPGLDPEISTGGINMGIDSGAWPTPKQFLIRYYPWI